MSDARVSDVIMNVFAVAGLSDGVNAVSIAMLVMSF